MRRATTLHGIAAGLIGILATAWAGAAAEQGPASAVTVAVQGVRVIKPPPGGDDTLLAFSDFSGTAVVLLVTDPRGGLVVFDGDSSRVQSFVDDKGKDLTKPEPGTDPDARPGNWVFQPMPTVSTNRKYCSVQVSMPGLPTKQATRLAISGKLAFQVAHEKKKLTAEKVALRAGTKIDGGMIPLTIKRAGKSQWFSSDDKEFEVEFQANQNTDAIASIRFFNSAGKQLEAREIGRGFTGSADSPSTAANYDASLDYRLKNAAYTATIVITYWSDMKKISVPFHLTVGVGL